MRLLRNLFAGLAALFVLAAVISFIVNFDRVESTTSALGLIGFGFGMVGLVLARMVRRGTP